MLEVVVGLGRMSREVDVSGSWRRTFTSGRRERAFRMLLDASRRSAKPAAAVGPGDEPGGFACRAVGLRERRQELSGQEAALQNDIYDASGRRDFFGPLDRFVAIIECLLPTPIEADYVLGHCALITLFRRVAGAWSSRKAVRLRSDTEAVRTR